MERVRSIGSQQRASWREGEAVGLPFSEQLQRREHVLLYLQRLELLHEAGGQTTDLDSRLISTAVSQTATMTEQAQVSKALTSLLPSERRTSASST